MRWSGIFLLTTLGLVAVRPSSAQESRPSATVVSASPGEAHAVVPPPPRVHPTTYLLGGVGLVGVIAGSTFGVLAMQQKAHAEDHCSDAQRLCDSVGVAANRRGQSYAAVSLATLALGGTFLTAAIWLYQDQIKRAKVTARVSPQSATLNFEARF